jgi:hypothetical protein
MNFLMELFTKENSKTIECTEKDIILIKMGIDGRGSLWREFIKVQSRWN